MIAATVAVASGKPVLLVTGGAGFIGSHIAEQALDKYEVHVVDNFVTGKLSNVPAGATCHHADITSIELLDYIFSTVKPEYVSHQAAHLSVPASVKNVMFDLKSNIIGSVNVFEMSLKHKVKGVVIASSGGSVYGSIETPPDELSPLNPKSPYAISKSSVDMYAKFYREMKGLNVKVLRYSNVYGTRMSPNPVISIFMRKALAGENITVFGDCLRDYVHVSDVAKLNLMALENPTFPDVMNVGTGVGTRNVYLAFLIKDMIGSNSTVIIQANREGDVEVSRLNVDVMLQYLPKPVQLHQGLEELALASGVVSLILKNQ